MRLSNGLNVGSRLENEVQPVLDYKFPAATLDFLGQCEILNPYSQQAIMTVDMQGDLLRDAERLARTHMESYNDPSHDW